MGRGLKNYRDIPTGQSGSVSGEESEVSGCTLVGSG